MTFPPDICILSFILFDTKVEGRKEQIIADSVIFARRTAWREQPDTFFRQLGTCVIGKPRNTRPKNAVKVWSRVILETIFSAFHSISSSVKHRAMFKPIPVPDRIGEAAWLFPSIRYFSLSARFPQFCCRSFSLHITPSTHLTRMQYFTLCLGFWNYFSDVLLLCHWQNQIV